MLFAFLLVLLTSVIDVYPAHALATYLADAVVLYDKVKEEEALFIVNVGNAEFRAGRKYTVAAFKDLINEKLPLEKKRLKDEHKALKREELMSFNIKDEKYYRIIYHTKDKALEAIELAS